MSNNAFEKHTPEQQMWANDALTLAHFHWSTFASHPVLANCSKTAFIISPLSVDSLKVNLILTVKVAHHDACVYCSTFSWAVTRCHAVHGSRHSLTMQLPTYSQSSAQWREGREIQVKDARQQSAGESEAIFFHLASNGNTRPLITRQVSGRPAECLIIPLSCVQFSLVLIILRE